MRKNISLICMALLVSAIGAFALPKAKVFKQNAQQELASTQTRYKVPVELPARMKHQKGVKTIKSNASASFKTPGASFAPMFSSQEVSNVYGWLNYYDDPTYKWEQVGMNQVYANGTYSTIFKCWDSPSVAFYHDNKVHTYLTLFDDYNINILGVYYSTYDFETGTLLTYEEVPLDDSCLGAFINMTFNHDDNTAYGYTYDYNSSTGVSFAKIIMTNPTNVLSVKKDVDPSQVCSAMTYHDGKIYGINFNGEFVTITTAGEQTAYFTPTFENDNTSTLNYGALLYSPQLNGFLWANMWDADNSAHLYKIDAEAESVVKLADYSNTEQFISFFTPTYEENPAAPNYIEIVSNTFAGTPNNYGSFQIRVPSTTIDGSAIPADQKVTVTLMIGSDETWVEDYEPGALETIELKNLPEGMIPFSFIGSIGDLKTRKSYPLYIGYDVPKTPSNVLLSVDKLSWDPVTEGANKGYFEPENVTYTVYLNDERVARDITETSLDINLEDSEYGVYVAEVYAKCNGKESAPGNSNGVIGGGAIELDYYCEPVPEDLALYTVINGFDDSTWTYTEADGDYYKENCLEIGTYYSKTNSYGIDDWLILPPLKFEDGNELYSFAADFANSLELANFSQYVEIFYTVYLGTAPTPEAMTTAISETRGISHNKFTTYTDKFQIKEAGTYYIGIHTEYTAAELPLPSSLMMRNINVKAENVSLGGPGAVTDAKVTAAADAELKATVEFNMPTTTIDGDALDPETVLTAYVETEVAYDPVEGKPGERVSLAVETIQGDNIVRITPYIEKNRGYEIELSVYTGVDVPGPVTNLKETIAEDNRSLKVTWEAPTTGENGGVVKPTGNKYYCAVPSSDGWEIIDEIGTDVFEYEYIYRPEELGLVQFGIIAENAAGQGETFAISSAILGTPYELPMIETIPSYEMTYGPCYSYEIDDTYSALWRVTELYLDEEKSIDFRRDDGSGYALACSPRRIAAECKGRWGLPKFSTIGAEDPVLKYDLWISPDMPTVEIWAEAPGIELKKVGTLKDTSGASYEGWDEITLDLPDEFKDKGWVATYIELSFEEFNQIFFLYGYEYKDNVAYDFEVTSLAGKRHPFIYKDANYEAVVTNRGYETSFAPAAKWQVMQNGKVIAEQIVEEAGSDKKYEEHEVVRYTYTLNANADNIGEAEVVFTLTSPDAKAKNDSQSFDIEIQEGSALAVTDLKGMADETGESIELTWTEPAVNTLVEGFEDCNAFDASATQLGEFKNIDRDGMWTYGYNGWYRPNIDPETGHGEPASFIVWNVEDANKVAEEAGALVKYDAYSGDHFAIAFVPFPTEQYVVPVPADDWLISPEVKGGTEVSFAAKPLYYAYGPEVVRIMVSTTTDDIESFTLLKNLEIGKYSNPNSDPVWEVFTVTLPEDAKYFALNYVSQDIFGLMLDDISYTPNVDCNITGYDIYRNDEVIENNLNVIASYTDKNVTYGETYSYNILPILTTGKGEISNTAVVTATTVGNITSDQVIAGTKGAIVVKGFAGKNVAIYTTDGKTIYNGSVETANAIISAEAGVYVVTADKTTTKVIVK